MRNFRGTCHEERMDEEPLDEELVALCRDLEAQLEEAAREKEKPETRAQATRRRCLAGDCCVYSFNYSRGFKFGDHSHCGHVCKHRCSVAGCHRELKAEEFEFRPGKRLMIDPGFASARRNFMRSKNKA